MTLRELLEFLWRFPTIEELVLYLRNTAVRTTIDEDLIRRYLLRRGFDPSELEVVGCRAFYRGEEWYIPRTLPALQWFLRLGRFTELRSDL